jgi:hypothetical protein
VTLASPVIVTVQVGIKIPEQAPPQLTKTDPNEGVAVRVTAVPLLYGAEQAVPQLMPGGFEVTVPLLRATTF